MEYDDHCRLTAGGEEWWITAMQGHGFIMVRNERTVEILDLSHVRWREYQAACRAQRFPTPKEP